MKDHDKDVAEFEKQARGVHDADLKAWAGNRLPTLQDHQKLAHELAGKVGTSKTSAEMTSKKEN